MDNAEITITFRKLADNLKRYFWIIIVAILVGIAISISSLLVPSVETEERYEIQKVFAIHKTDGAEGMTVATTDLLADILLMSDTNEFSLAVESEMEEHGFPDYNFTMDNTERSSSGNVITFNFQASDKQETEILAQVYSEQMIKNMNSFLDDQSITLNSDLSETSARDVSSDNEDSNIFSVKNIFIVVLCITAGLIIIFILTLLDKFVRDKNEIVGFEDSLVLGTLKKKDKERCSLVKTAYCVKQYVETNGLKQICFLSFAPNKVNQNIIDQLLETCSKLIMKEIQVDYCNNILKNYENVDQLKESSIIIFLCVNADKRPEVEEGIELLDIAGKRPGAVVYID